MAFIPIRRAALGTAACVVLLGSGLGAAVPTDEEVKIAFLYQFTQFVEWPSDAHSSEPQFVVAVLASDDLWALAQKALSAKKAGDLPLSLRRISEPSEAANAQILFVGATEGRRLPEILKVVDGKSVLTIGDSVDFAERGGIIGFRTVDNRVRFDINVGQATRAGLRISSEVLKLARVVRTKGQP